jgi:RNA polymerase sigma-70 factor, ECF subfamily
MGTKVAPPDTSAATSLLERLRAQEQDSVSALVDAHYDRVHRYLARLLGDAETAADLTQETFVNAFRALPRLADDTNLSGWLFRIATNLARQHHRRAELVSWVPLAEEATQPAMAGRMEDEIAERDEVHRALECLPLDHRACLLLCAWGGLRIAEFAPFLGTSTDAVRMMLVRARREFRAAYGTAVGL